MSATAPALPAKKRTAKITSKGQITIPAEVRRQLGVESGDQLVFERLPDGFKIVRQAEENPFEKMSGGGLSRRMLTDFLVGAHASVRGYSLLTLDRSIFRAAFPKLRLESF